MMMLNKSRIEWNFSGPSIEPCGTPASNSVEHFLTCRWIYKNRWNSSSILMLLWWQLCTSAFSPSASWGTTWTVNGPPTVLRESPRGAEHVLSSLLSLWWTELDNPESSHRGLGHVIMETRSCDTWSHGLYIVNI